MRKKTTLTRIVRFIFFLFISYNLSATNLNSIASHTFIPTHNLQYKIASFFVNLFSKNNESQIKKTQHSNINLDVSTLKTLKTSSTLSLAAADAIGDFRSVGNGNWTSLSTWEYFDGSNWITPTAAIGYPGQYSGTNNVTILSGDTVSVDNITTQSMGDVIVNGTLALNPGGSPWEVELNTENIAIDGSSATLDFSGSQASLLLPAMASVTFRNGGDIAGSCTPNNEIIIDGVQYAACRNPSAGSYTFGQVVAAGGTINAQITTSSPSSPVEACTTINLEGGYAGTGGTSVNYNWLVRDPSGTFTNIGTGSLGNPVPTSTTTASYTPTTVGEYVIFLEVTDGSVTNAANVVFTITDDITDPTITAPATVTVSANASCEATGVALGTPTTGDNCGVASVTN
ncbi:hypothetical protein KO566_12245, partial [Flavobacteriaceae bacterium XHP0103]|uniref:hypothetical protein n=1 Tax=Marixanthotalea marina TaxID=2844359 RepID=UPI002989BA2A